MSLTGQGGTGSQAGAPIVINAGAGGGANGGNVNIGGGNDSQVGGSVSLSAGSGTLSQGGAASLDGGNGLTGGAVNVVAGTGTSGNGGTTNIEAGGSTTGDAGDVILKTHTGVGGVYGKVRIPSLPNQSCLSTDGAGNLLPCTTVLSNTVTLTSADILALNTTPFVLVPSCGTSCVIAPQWLDILYTFVTTDYYDAAGLQMYVNEGSYQSNGYPLYFLVPNVGASTAVSFNWGGELVSPSVPNLLWTHNTSGILGCWNSF